MLGAGYDRPAPENPEDDLLIPSTSTPSSAPVDRSCSALACACCLCLLPALLYMAAR